MKAQSELYGDVKSLTETIRPRRNVKQQNWIDDFRNNMKSTMGTFNEQLHDFREAARAPMTVAEAYKQATGKDFNSISSISIDKRVSNCPTVR